MSENDAPAMAAPARASDEHPPGLKMIVIGAIILFLAPLAGFLGGTMIGSPASETSLDPMFLWLFVGMVAGGVGGAIVLLGVLRWLRSKPNDSDGSDL
ncbi:hypothetical protein [Arthrobacter sp. E3]|uniref:hypothetical protein n=1 Tax=Arthrobacter sp. E3 TaxID=517402 RepID=UPI001A94F492|nr:hypothetical protein [Arthrobacter sp. E3]